MAKNSKVLQARASSSGPLDGSNSVNGQPSTKVGGMSTVRGGAPSHENLGSVVGGLVGDDGVVGKGLATVDRLDITVSNEATGTVSNKSASTVMNRKSIDGSNSVLCKEGDSSGLELQGAEKQAVTADVNLDAGHLKVVGTTVGVNTGKIELEQKKTNVSFACLFKNNRKADANYKLEYVDTGAEKLVFKDEDVDTVEQTFGICLLGYVVNGRPPTAALIALVRRWGPNITFQTHESGWITFNFPSIEEKEKIIEKGPYMVYGYHLFLKEMPRFFRFLEEDLTTLSLWVRIHGIPPSCWNRHILSRIASKLGRPVHMDMLTHERKRVNYARVLIEIDTSKPRVETINVGLSIGDLEVSFVYEDKLEFCNLCKKLGHKDGSCMQNSEVRNSTEDIGMEHAGSEHVLENRGRSRSIVWRRSTSRGRNRPVKRHARSRSKVVQPPLVTKPTLAEVCNTSTSRPLEIIEVTNDVDPTLVSLVDLKQTMVDKGKSVVECQEPHQSSFVDNIRVTEEFTEVVKKKMAVLDGKTLRLGTVH